MDKPIGHGAFEHAQHAIRLDCDRVAEDPTMRERYPRTAFLLLKIGEAVYDAVDEIDGVLSGETPAQEDVILDGQLEIELADALTELRLEEGGPDEN